MKPNQLVLRCYAEHRDGTWQALCLDFTLAAQGDSPEGVIEKLEAQICEYVEDALVGIDKDHSKELIKRKAPPKYWAKYYYYRSLIALHRAKSDLFRLSDIPMPLTPKGC